MRLLSHGSNQSLSPGFRVTDLLKLSSSEIELITGCYRVRLKTRHPDPEPRDRIILPLMRYEPRRSGRLTGGGVDEKITLRIAAADGEDELLG